MHTTESEQGADPKSMVQQHQLRERAHRHMQVAEYDKAVPILETILRFDAKNPMAHNELGAVLAELSRWKEAETHYRRSIALARHHAGPHAALAKIYFKGLSDFKAAEREVRMALRIDDQNPAYWTLKGDLLHAQDNMEEAAKAYKRSVDLGGQSAPLYVGYASALTNLGHLQEAKAMAEEALRIDSGNQVARHNLGVILF